MNALAMVPARLLPYKHQWQALANALPTGSILLCLPSSHDARHQAAWNAIVLSVCTTGHPVLVLPLGRLLKEIRFEPAE